MYCANFCSYIFKWHPLYLNTRCNLTCATDSVTSMGQWCPPVSKLATLVWQIESQMSMNIKTMYDYMLGSSNVCNCVAEYQSSIRVHLSLWHICMIVWTSSIWISSLYLNCSVQLYNRSYCTPLSNLEQRRKTSDSCEGPTNCVLSLLTNFILEHFWVKLSDHMVMKKCHLLVFVCNHVYCLALFWDHFYFTL